MTHKKRQPDVPGGGTRHDVMSLLLKLGPVTATEIGESLGLSAAGVRRHLDKLVEENYAETCEPHAVAGEGAGRGRPAKHFRLTQHGRNLFGNHYDTMAAEAFGALRALGGDDAVRALAKQRVNQLLAGIEGAALGADNSEMLNDDQVEDVARELARTLDESGYAATVTRAGNGIQICQHHCPVAAVAAQHPELCEAEHQAISALVGRHIQPLALIADGNGICTTNIPLARATQARNPSERSGDID
ncbi:helix-turn-helix transcriptional regulator [Corynebacterium mayonis]|uniref:helix-turn-helix transcriptional regulator n=1 Tax=Corynebacterium mayonis TaxID=3062461 RepID=UPI00314094FD